MALAAAERLTITAACDHALAVDDVRRAMRLAATVPMGLLAERRAMLLRLLAADPEAPSVLRARAWSTLANLASDVGDGAGQADAAAEALAAAEDAGDDAQVAWARVHRGFRRRLRRDEDRARPLRLRRRQRRRAGGVGVGARSS